MAKINEMAPGSLEFLSKSETSIKFIVVRHPLTRFVSNWDDHFCTGYWSKYDEIKFLIILQNRSGLNLRDQRQS